MNTLQIHIRAEMFSKNLKYRKVAEKILRTKDVVEAESILATLPSNEQLFEQLVKELEGKSVYAGIKKLVEGRSTSKYDAVKTYSSILTHAAIGCKDNPEYELLFESLLQKIYSSLER